MAGSAKKQTVLPMVSCAMAQPFVTVMLRHGVLAEDALKNTGLSLRDIQDGHAPMLGQHWYDLVERSSLVAGNPHLGFEIGFEIATQHLPNFQTVTLAEASLAEIITKLIIDAESLTSLANYEMRVMGSIARLTSERKFRPRRRPGQIDGYFAGFVCRLLSDASGPNWQPADLRIWVVEPAALPKDIAPGMGIHRSTTGGTRFEFPSSWLLRHLDGSPSQSDRRPVRVSETFLSDFRRLLDLYLHTPSLSLESFSAISEQSPRKIKAELARHGTSFKRELDTRRAERAKALLRDRNLSLPEIANRVGYGDTSSFCRAYKRWTGHTPRSRVPKMANNVGR